MATSAFAMPVASLRHRHVSNADLRLESLDIKPFVLPHYGYVQHLAPISKLWQPLLSWLAQFISGFLGEFC
jgi:hypothetical protein